MGIEPHGPYRFSGSLFYPETGELTKGKYRVRISEQNARLLRLLLEHRGDMVTREQVRLALWPEGEILQYDQSINRAVSQLRSILRDHSPKARPLIETIPKRGYRMAAGTDEAVLPPASEKTLEPTAAAPSPDANASLADPPVSDRAEDLPRALLPESSPSQDTGFKDTGSGDFDLKTPPANPMRFARLFPRKILWPALACFVLFSIAGVALVRGRSRPAGPGAIPLTIASFESSGPDADILAESLRANLTDALSQDPGLQVHALHTLSASSLLSESGGSNGLRLFGKLFVRGNQCQLHLELVSAAGDTHLASFEYQGNRNELAVLSDRAETDLFRQLHPQNAQAILDISRIRPASLKAYAQYLQGRALLLLWTDDALMQAIVCFQNALAEDPHYARAYAGMASAYFVMSQHQATSPNSALEKAGQAADKALSLDPNLAEAHAIRGLVALMRDWNFSGAQQSLRRAVSQDPNHAIYHQWLAMLYGLKGAHDEALAEIDNAESKDPDWAPLYMTEIFLDSNAGRFDRAEAAAAKLLRLKPDWPLAHEQFAMSLWAEKKYEQAISEWRAAAVLEGAGDRIALEEEGLRALHAGGPSAYARVRLHAIATHRGVTHAEQDFLPSEWEAYAGNSEEALVELTRLVKDHSAAALQIPGNPAYNRLHGDERYLALVRQIGLAPAVSISEKRGSREGTGL